jgi:hypothetical protein
MAINACSIAGFTIAGKSCRDKFPDLIPLMHRGAGGGTSQSVKWLHLKQQQERERLEQAARPTELERIIVSASFQDLRGDDAQDVKPSNDLVTVSDIFVTGTTVDVNIDSFKIH